MSIQLEQNKSYYINLLKAASHLYSRAKFYGSLRVIIAIAAVVFAPFLLILVPSSDLAIGLTGAVLTLISELWLEAIEDKLKEKAAKIQEQFDTGLFALDWNEICVGAHLTPEVTSSATSSYKGNYPFSNWYPDTTGIPRPLDILICQRASLVWDWRLRQHFAALIVWVAIAWGLAIVLFGHYEHTDLDKYLIAMIFPALPALSQTIKAWRGHTKNASEKQELEGRVNSLWQRGIGDPAKVSIMECRGLQDCIFLLRKEGPMVPDFWYGNLRNRFENDMHQTASKFREDALKKFGIPG